MKAQGPKVSVIVPAYNVAPYLPRCLDSLVNQTLHNIEIICIDDKSTDNSLEILREYAKKDKRIKVIALKKNSGAPAARNAGIDAATGEYMGFVDADDYVDTNFYEKLYATANEAGADIAKSNAKITEYNSTKRFDDTHIDRIRMFGKWRFLYQWWTGLYRTDMIRKNNIKFPVEIISGQDIVFLTECVNVANKVALCPDTFYHYLRREDSLDSQMLSPAKLESRLGAMRAICNIYNKADMPADEYMLCYHDRFNAVKGFFGRNTSIECKMAVAETMVDLYKECHDKNGLLAMHVKYHDRNKDYISFLQSHDAAGLCNYMIQSNAITFDEYNQIAENKYKKTFWLFCALPIIRVQKNAKYIKVEFCGIDILKIKQSPSECRICVLYIPILRVKTK